MHSSVAVDVVEELSSVGVGQLGAFLIAYIFIDEFVFVPVLVKLLAIDVFKIGYEVSK